MKINKFLSSLCILLLCLTSLSGCGDGNDNSANSPDKAKWTIMLYLCGTDLESDGGAATLNLEEIMAAETSDEINFVIETGGASAWDLEDISTDCLSRYIKNGDELELVETKPLERMSDAKTYTDFLTWASETYPAEKYMLVVWDHGMGSVDGVVYDELYDEDEPGLTVKEIADGVAATGETFELVGFDACLMSTLEQASALCPYAHYMVASEETEPGEGWDYTAWLNYLSADPDMNGDELGIKIVDSFYEKCESSDQEADCTLAVTDLSKIPALVEDYNAMAKEMKGFTSDTQSIKVITGAFKSAENYGGNNAEEDYTDMVDLGDMTLNAEGVLSDTGEKVLDDLIAAVVYHKNGIARSKGAGLSVYVPLSGSEERYDRYATDAAISGDYLRFLEALYGFDTPDNVEIITPVVAADETITTETSKASDYAKGSDMSSDYEQIKYTYKVNEDGYIQIDVSEGDEIIDAARCNLYWYNEDDATYYFLGSDYTVDISDDWKQYKDNFNGTWVTMNDTLCELIIKGISDDCISYAVPVLVNDQETNIQMIYRFDTGEYEILGLWDGNENGIPSRNLRQLKDGDTVDFRFKAKDSLDGESKEAVFEGFKVNGKIEICDEFLFDGLYSYSITFEDIFGGETETPWATIILENGDIYSEFE